MATQNYRLINIDRLEPDSPSNFDVQTLSSVASNGPQSVTEAQSVGQEVRGLLRGGDAFSALRAALGNAPYGADERTKDAHLATVIETLQGIRAAEMSPLLTRIQSEGSVEELDVLMKYLYKGMASGIRGVSPQPTGYAQRVEGGTSVLLSWHEKVVEVAGPGSIVRVMTDRRTV